MSDDYDYDDMSDGVYYPDDDEDMDVDVDVENQYYNAKGALAEGDSLAHALECFQRVLDMEEGQGEWGFKALKQIIKIYCQLNEYDQMMDAYKTMLSYVHHSNVVTRNQSEKKISSLLEYLSQLKDASILQQIYETTLKSLQDNQNERLWFRTNLRLCSLFFIQKDFNQLGKLIKSLKASCKNEDGSIDMKKGTQLLEVHAVEIQMHTERQNNKKLKELYYNALTIKTAIPHPRIMGIIRECGGKMHMADEQWSKANTDFFEAFKSYDEAGASRRIQCLKYLVLATMLMESAVDPFTAQESQPYRNDPEIKAMTNLVDAYQRNDIKEFEKILRTEEQSIMGDDFIKQYLEDLRRKVRTQVLLNMIQPYTRVTLAFVAKKLDISTTDVEQLLVAMILDNRIDGYIDQVNGILELGDKRESCRNYGPVNKLIERLEATQSAVAQRLQCISQSRGDNDEGLRAVLGAFDLTMLGVGAIIGAGVFVLTGEAAKEFAGPSIVLSYFFSSVAAVLLALSYVEFGVDLPMTGGAFNYIRLILGEFIAWQAGSCLILEYTVGAAAVSKGFSGYLSSLIGLGTSSLVVETWIFDLDLLAFCLITTLAVVLAFGTKESSLLNAVIACINLSVILFILFAAASKAEQEHFTPFMPEGLQNTFRASAVVFFAYVGFDSLVTVSGEVKNPKRDLPIGVVGSILISTVLYISMAAALSGMIPYSEIDVSAPFSEAFVEVGMRWAGRVVSIGAITGIVTSVLASLLGQSRIYIVLGREQLLPPWIAAIDEKRSTPKHALFVQWLTCGLLALLFDIDILSRMVSMGTLFVLCLVSLAALQRSYAIPQESDSSSIWPRPIRFSLLLIASIVEGASFAAEAHPAVYLTATGVVIAVAFSFYLLPVTYVPVSFVTPLKPLTPCAAIFAGIHLIFSLGWEAHLLFLVWQILAAIIYISYGMHHSPEPVQGTAQELQMNSTNEKQSSGLLQPNADRSDNVVSHQSEL